MRDQSYGDHAPHLAVDEGRWSNGRWLGYVMLITGPFVIAVCALIAYWWNA